MAAYTLTGSGIQALSAGVGALHVHIDTLPVAAGHGSANPVNYYQVGSIRPGDTVAFWAPMLIDAADAWIPMPNGTTRIGYEVRDLGQITVTEVVGASPLSGPAGATGSTGATGPTGPSGSALISDQTVTGSVAATVDFTSLGTYINLVLRWQARSNVVGTADNMMLRFNSDTGNNYDYNVAALNTAVNGAVVAGQPAAVAGAVNGTTTPANSANGGWIFFPNYRGTTWWKTFFGAHWRIDTASGFYQEIASGNWRNTGAITGIRLYPASSSFLVGSRFTLFGEQ